jgi:hypothetical protein
MATSSSETSWHKAIYSPISPPSLNPQSVGLVLPLRSVSTVSSLSSSSTILSTLERPFTKLQYDSIPQAHPSSSSSSSSPSRHGITSIRRPDRKCSAASAASTMSSLSSSSMSALKRLDHEFEFVKRHHSSSSSQRWNDNTASAAAIAVATAIGFQAAPTYNNTYTYTGKDSSSSGDGSFVSDAFDSGPKYCISGPNSRDRSFVSNTSDSGLKYCTSGPKSNDRSLCSNTSDDGPKYSISFQSSSSSNNDPRYNNNNYVSSLRSIAEVRISDATNNYHDKGGDNDNNLDTARNATGRTNNNDLDFHGDGGFHTTSNSPPSPLGGNSIANTVGGRLEQVAPGVEMRFVGTISATWEAILDGRGTVVPCCCCTIELHCMQGIDFVICPDCGVTCPVDLEKYHNSNTMSSLPLGGGESSVLASTPPPPATIGLGFSSQVILEKLKEEEQGSPS